jgi:hypothetical protein
VGSPIEAAHDPHNAKQAYVKNPLCQTSPQAPVTMNVPHVGLSQEAPPSYHECHS